MSQEDGTHTPPRLGEWLLQSFCSYDFLNTALWDLEEIYVENREDKGRVRADLIYLRDVLGVVYHLRLKGKSQYATNNIAMLKNNIVMSLRGFKKDKVYSFLNVLGLSSGLIIFMLIGLYTSYEFGYDDHHTQNDRIFRVYKTINNLEEPYVDTGTPGPLADAMKAELPEVLHAARFASYRNVLVEVDGEKFIEPEVHPVDPDVFDIFSFEVVTGNMDDFLMEPNTIAMSESVAMKYFGRMDVLDETVLFADQLPMKVSGVFKDQSDHGHFKMNMLVQFESVTQAFNENLSNWGNNPYTTYLLAEKGVSKVALQDKLPALRAKFANDPIDEDGQVVTYLLESLKEVHFSTFGRGLGDGTVDLQRLYLFLVIAFAVLIMASINYINLSTARARVRMKAAGIRKVIGARRSDLIRQFLVDSGLLVFFSLCIALVVVSLVLPSFAAFTDRPLALDYTSPTLWLSLGLLWVFLTLLSGIYPALATTAFNPVTVLKGVGVHLRYRGIFRNALVVFQYTLSAVLIISALVLNQQLHYIDTKDTGYSRDQIVILSTRDDAVDDRLPTYMEALRQVSGVDAVATSWSLPTRISSDTRADWTGIEDIERIPMKMVGVTHDFFDLYDIEVIEGRKFDPERKGDRNGMLLNETAVKALGWENPIGREMITQQGRKTQVIGIVKDFHIHSLREEIKPLQILLDGRYATLAVSIKGDMDKALTDIEEIYESFSPVYPFSYRSFEDIYDKAYTDDTKTAQLTLWFTLLAIVIAALGLYGLVAHSVQQKIKELGVRKVMGASVINIIKLLSKEFIGLLLIAFVIATPLAWYLMDGWLDDFAYHISLSPFTFLLALALMLSVAAISVGYRTYRAAVTNPVRSLRVE